MNPASTAVAAAADLSAGFQVQLDGASLDPSRVGRLVELRVETALGTPDQCTLRIADTAYLAQSAFTVLDDDSFKLGATVIVKLAAAIGGELGAVFQGEVTGVEVDLDEGAAGGDARQELILTAHDKSHRLHRTSNTRTMRQVTAADVARKIAQSAGLKVGTLASVVQGQPMETVTQVDESDWAFLSRLVRDHGGELDVQAGALTVLDPAQAGSAAAEIVWGEGLRRFRGRTSSLAQVAEVVVRAWDPKGKQAVEGTGTPKAASSKGDADVAGQVSGSRALVSTSGALSAGDAKAYAQAVAQRIGHERVQAEATTSGDPRLLAGQHVTVKGVGARFSGTHRIVSAVHLLSQDGYRTELTLGAGGRPLAADVGAAVTEPARFATSLAVGIVTSNGDPDKQGRVKVKYATLDADTESGWARVARGASGNGRGAVATLEVGDEVIVGFEHGSPQKPIVLGAVFNGKDLPGEVLPQSSASFAARFPRDFDVLTKGKGTLQAEKGLTVGAKTGPMELSAGGAVSLKATQPEALTLETPGQLKMSGKQGAELQANGPLKVTATGPVTIESNAVLQLKGASIQIQGQGVVQVSGATVMLG